MRHYKLVFTGKTGQRTRTGQAEFMNLIEHLLSEPNADLPREVVRALESKRC